MTKKESLFAFMAYSWTYGTERLFYLTIAKDHKNTHKKKGLVVWKKPLRNT